MKRTVFTPYLVTLLISAAFVVLGLVMDPGDALGYSLLVYYIVMPIVVIGSSVMVSIKSGWEKWIYPIFAGIITSLISWPIFGYVWFGYCLFMLILAFIITVITTGVRLLVNRVREQKKNKDRL